MLIIPKQKIISIAILALLAFQPFFFILAEETTNQNQSPVLARFICDNSNCIGEITAQVTEDVVGVLPFVYNAETNTVLVNISPEINLIYTYDNNGNLISDGIWTNTWDYQNRLIQSTKTDSTGSLQAGTTISYAYDHTGQRVKMTNGTTTTVYPNKYYNTDGTKKTKNIYIGDTLIATIETVGTTVTPYYVHTDHLGSTNVVTDSTGTQKELLDYYPYGTIRLDQKTGSFSEQRKYIGEEYDDATSLSYLNARYYQSQTGKFISQDPVFLNPESQGREIFTAFLSDPQTQNSYGYARNNPVTNSDPNGKWYKEFVTGQQSWSSFSGEVGQATQYMGGGWQMAMNHPVVAGAVVGVGGGLGFAGASTGATALSLATAAGWGTQNMGNLNRLAELPQVKHGIEGLAKLSNNLGQSSQEILKQVSTQGTSYVDYLSKNLGNINTYIQQSEKSLIRITTNPEITRIISAGKTEASQLANNIANGRQVPLLNSRGISGLIKGIISSLKK